MAASGRHAAYGDALARILEHHGHDVSREYYFNDAGSQIRLLGESVQARARGEELPEGGYQGDYVADVAARIAGAADGDVAVVAQRRSRFCSRASRARSSATACTSTASSASARCTRVAERRSSKRSEILDDAGHTYRHEGAVWLRTTTFGDDKDRVVVRSSGEPTYLAADIAYLQNKRERGFDRQLMPVGSDHHGYVRELKAAMAALGGDPDTIELPILQFVHLVAEGETLRCPSARASS